VRLLYLTERVTLHERRIVGRVRAAGHEVEVAVLLAADDTDSVPGLSLQGTSGRERVARLREFARARQFDLTVAGPVTSAAWVAARAHMRPLVAMSWAYDLLRDAAQSSRLRTRARAAFAACRMLVADARVVASAARSLGYAGEVVTVPWGVDIEQFSLPSETEVPGLPPPLVLSIRAWEPMYGVETVVRAFAIARREVPGLRLTLTNHGGSHDQIVRAIAKAGVGGAIELPGRIEEADLASRMRRAQVYVSASEVDGSSISLLQAMASGLPIVASDIPGNREWLDGRIGARLCPVGDERAFAMAIAETVSLPHARRMAVAHRLRRIAEERADWRENGRRLVEAYERAAST